MIRTTLTTMACLLSATALADGDEPPAMDMLANSVLADFRAVATPVSHAASLTRSVADAQRQMRFSPMGSSCGDISYERADGVRTVTADFGDGCQANSGPMAGQYVAGAVAIERTRGGGTVIDLMGLEMGPHAVDGSFSGIRTRDANHTTMALEGAGELIRGEMAMDMEAELMMVRDVASYTVNGAVTVSNDTMAQNIWADSVQFHEGAPCGIPSSGVLGLEQGEVSVEIEFIGEGWAEISTEAGSMEANLCLPPSH